MVPIFWASLYIPPIPLLHVISSLSFRLPRYRLSSTIPSNTAIASFTHFPCATFLKRDPQNIWDPQKKCGSFRRRYIVGTLTQ